MPLTTFIKQEKRPRDTYNSPYYLYLQVTANEGKIYFIREKYQMIRNSNESRKTSQAFAMSLDAKKWHSGKIDFLKENGITE
jgi:hypothetical protein